MTDHVTRMVDGWLEQAKSRLPEREAASSLVNSIHRMIREAEQETQRRCAEVALRAGSSEAAKVAMAIRAIRTLRRAHASATPHAPLDDHNPT